MLRRLRVSGTDGYVDALGAGSRSISLTYAFEVFVIAVVGAVLIAGLYQLVRDQVRGIVDKVRGRRAPAPAVVRKGQ